METSLASVEPGPESVEPNPGSVLMHQSEPKLRGAQLDLSGSTWADLSLSGFFWAYLGLPGRTYLAYPFLSAHT